MDHRTRLQPVSVPDLDLYLPRCTCGWKGEMNRLRRYATDQIDEHLAETAGYTQTELF